LLSCNKVGSSSLAPRWLCQLPLRPIHCGCFLQEQGHLVIEYAGSEHSEVCEASSEDRDQHQLRTEKEPSSGSGTLDCCKDKNETNTNKFSGSLSLTSKRPCADMNKRSFCFYVLTYNKEHVLDKSNK
jgi:hypothetical protein